MTDELSSLRQSGEANKILKIINIFYRAGRAAEPAEKNHSESAARHQKRSSD